MAITPKSAAHELPQYVSLATAAEQLSVHIATIRRVAKKLDVPIVTVGKAHRIRVEHVALLLKKKGV
jgi:hypothetical protein